jgi:hypothetical protein
MQNRFCFALSLCAILCCLPFFAAASELHCEDGCSEYRMGELATGTCVDAECFTLADIQYESLFVLTVDSLWLTHSGSSFRSEILDPNNNSVVVAQELEYGIPIAPRIRLGVLLLEDLRTEFSYFGTSDWESTASLRNVPPVPDLSADIAYEAELQNFEWNFLSGQSDVDSHWILGMRYLEYTDSFVEDYRLDTGFGPVITERASGEVENRALGPQVGVGFDFGGGSTFIHFGSKLGFMNNQIEQFGPGYLDAITIDGNPETTFRSKNDEFAWLVDLDITGHYFISNHIAIRVGYQGLFLDRIAQAATQRGQQALADDISFHGAVFGVQWMR